MKSEPDVYSVDDLQRDGWTHWDGVRNYQARNFMRDQMKLGDRVLFYHSNCSPPGVAGLAHVVRESYPDFTAWNPDSVYFDAKSTEESPRWFMVDIAFEEKFLQFVTLEKIRAEPRLANMPLLHKSRLSVQPVEAEKFQIIVRMGRKEGAHEDECRTTKSHRRPAQKTEDR